MVEVLERPRIVLVLPRARRARAISFFEYQKVRLAFPARPDPRGGTLAEGRTRSANRRAAATDTEKYMAVRGGALRRLVARMVGRARPRRRASGVVRGSRGATTARPAVRDAATLARPGPPAVCQPPASGRRTAPPGVQSTRGLQRFRAVGQRHTAERWFRRVAGLQAVAPSALLFRLKRPARCRTGRSPKATRAGARRAGSRSRTRDSPPLLDDAGIDRPGWFALM